MSEIKQILLLIGSPRAEISTSKSLGEYLCEQMETYGYSFQIEYINRLVNRQKKQLQLIEFINHSEIIIFSFPLYVDHLPSPLIKALEIIEANQEKILNIEQKKVVALSNSGFPESEQMKIALEICEIFCNDLGFQWMGGVGLGGGPMVHGRSLNELGNKMEDLKKGLELIAEALADDKDIPQEAHELVAKQHIPTGMYKMMGNFGWRIRALKYKNIFNLKKKPYNT